MRLDADVPDARARVENLSSARIAPHLDVTAVDGLGLVVLHDSSHELFAGPEYAAIARSLEHPHAEDDVVTMAAASVPLADAHRALADLRRAGVVVDPRPGDDACLAVTLAAVGTVDPEPFRHACDSAGIQIAGDGPLHVVLTDDYLRPELGEYNARALDTGTPWMPARPEGAEIWVGPVFVPDRGACWECLAQRLRRHRSVDRYLHDVVGRDLPIVRPGGPDRSTRMTAAGVIASIVRRWLAGAGRHEQLLSIDTATWATERHAVVRRPQCPACGYPDASLDQTARPPIDAGAPAPRPVPPERTIERFEHHVSPITGVVDRILPVGRRSAYHVYVAGTAPRVHGPNRDWTPRAGVGAAGKGTTAVQARASALCEALERYSGEFSGDEPRRTGALVDLAGARDPNECMGFSDAQYARRETTNATATSLRTTVPLPFDPNAVIQWTPVWSLTHGREELWPAAYCYYHAHVPGREMCVADSNGNAAGNTVEEAMLSGLLELVERDHVALWWYNRLRQPAVDLDSIDDPWLAAVRETMAGDGRRLWALDLTADLGIPVVVAISEPVDGTGDAGLGFGAHLDLTRATLRAVSENVQLHSGSASGGAGHGPPSGLRSSESAYLRPADTLPRAAAGVPPIAGLAECRRRIEDQGLDVAVLDQTRADIGLPVVKVIVPGLRHFWPRFAPGRLFDVPVKLGRLPAPLAEVDLNPLPPAA